MSHMSEKHIEVREKAWTAYQKMVNAMDDIEELRDDPALKNESEFGIDAIFDLFRAMNYLFKHDFLSGLGIEVEAASIDDGDI